MCVRYLAPSPAESAILALASGLGADWEWCLVSEHESDRPLRVGIAVECGSGWCDLVVVGWSEFVADNDYSASELAAISADLAAHGVVYLGGGAGVAYRLVAL